MSSNEKATIRIGNRDWEDVTDETTFAPIYSLYQVLSTNGEPEKIATNR